MCEKGKALCELLTECFPSSFQLGCHNPAFFCGIILRDIEVHGRFIEDIAVGSLYLDNRVSLSKGQLFRRDKRTFCIGVEHINGGGRRVSEGHCYGVAVRVINLKSRTGVRNGLSGFCVLLHDFDEAVKGCVVDKVAISRPILRNEHIKVGHQLAALPAGYLMDGVDAVRHILGLCKAVFVTGEIITLCVLGNLVAACGFQVHSKLCAAFGCFNLCFTVIGVLNNGDITLYDLLGHIICRLIMLHGIKLRLCTDLMNGGIKQIALRGSDLSHRPVVIADILLGNELPVFVGGIGINKGFALIDAVNSTGKRSITLRCAGFSIALGNGHGKLLQNIEEATVRDLVPVDRRRLRFGNNIIRSRNISMSCVFQNLAGLQNRYPQNLWQEIIGNCDAQLFLGCTDQLTAEFISARTGLASVAVSSKSKQLGTWRISNYTPEFRETSGVGKRPVLTPDEVLRLPLDQALIIIRGKKVLQVDKMDYSKHPEAKYLRSCKASAHVPEWRRLEEEAAKTPQPTPKPAPAAKKPAKRKATKPASPTDKSPKETPTPKSAGTPEGIITTDKDSILS